MVAEIFAHILRGYSLLKNAVSQNTTQPEWYQIKDQKQMYRMRSVTRKLVITNSTLGRYMV
jgi:hypothetical protein